MSTEVGWKSKKKVGGGGEGGTDGRVELQGRVAEGRVPGALPDWSCRDGG